MRHYRTCPLGLDNMMRSQKDVSATKKVIHEVQSNVIPFKKKIALSSLILFLITKLFTGVHCTISHY